MKASQRNAKRAYAKAHHPHETAVKKVFIGGKPKTLGVVITNRRTGDGALRTLRGDAPVEPPPPSITPKWLLHRQRAQAQKQREQNDRPRV